MVAVSMLACSSQPCFFFALIRIPSGRGLLMVDGTNGRKKDSFKINNKTDLGVRHQELLRLPL